MKEWEVSYQENIIKIENRWDGEKLFINGKLQDECIGLTSRSKLIGKLSDGRLVKVCIGGVFVIHCLIFIDDEEIFRA
jgi:hypothetical protein